MLARYVFYVTVLLGVVFYIAVLYFERPTVDESLFREAELYCLNQQWNDARAALRAVLRENPYHPGAHFYLGRAYMFGSDFRPIMAEGEFLTALSLFRKQNRQSGIERFTPKYFEMMCYIEAAKANLIQIDYYLSTGAPLAALQNLVQDSFFYAEQAQKISPNAPEVRDIMAILGQMRPRLENAPRQSPADSVVLTPEMTV
mgnify:CR=1 FL=1